MQRVLIAGGAGFIGSHLVNRLLEEKYSVTCIDNLITGTKNNIQKFLVNPQFSFLESDISTSLPQEINNTEWSAIFHLASPASPNSKSKNSYINHPIETMLVNSYGTYQLLELAKKLDANFLFASTSEIYGDPAISPQKEDYFGNVNSVGVRSVYDEAKRFGEAMTMSYHRTYSVKSRIVRIFNTYGPHMQIDDGRVVSNFITQALKKEPITLYGKGDQTRSFCYVSDMVEGLIQVMFTDTVTGEVVNIGNPDERTVSDLARIVKEMTQSSSEIINEELPPDDPKVRNPDITKIKQLTGWEPKVTLEEGLQKTIEYFRAIL